LIMERTVTFETEMMIQSIVLFTRAG